MNIDRLNGLYVGQLTADELDAFNAACEAGTARRSYEAPAGFMGLAKVRICHPETEAESAATVNANEATLDGIPDHDERAP